MSLKDHFDLVIFDWAGTMVDFGCQAPIQALIEAFAAQGVELDEATARRDMGRAKRDHVTSLLEDKGVASRWRAAHGRDPNPQDIEILLERLGPLMRARAQAMSALIPGAVSMLEQLRVAGVRVASSTGYTREMLEPVLHRAAEQGYQPEDVVCSGDTLAGRPSPLMIYKTCVNLGVWPLSRVVKVDDADAGIAEGKSAGAFTVGVASGNALGLSWEALQALPDSERRSRVDAARSSLIAAGADLAIDSVADLVPSLERAMVNRAQRR
jgi:phosphonoacetaldehyde hydrolase